MSDILTFSTSKIQRRRAVMHYLLSFLSGTNLTLAFAPFNNPIAPLVSFSVLLSILSALDHEQGDEFKIKKVFLLGLSFGVGHFSTGLYWISSALTATPIIAKNYSHFRIPAVSLISLVSGIYIGVATTATYSIWRFLKNRYYLSCNKDRIILSLLFALIWFITEIWRIQSIIPFPWLVLGHASQYSIHLMQLASFLPVSVLGSIILCISLTMYIRNKYYTITIMCTILLIYLWSDHRLNLVQYDKNISAIRKNNDDIRVLIIQPNITYPPLGLEEKKEALNTSIKTTNIALNNKEFKGNNIILWPESGYPFLVIAEEKKITNISLPKNSILISGADYYQINTKSLFNSMLVIDSNRIIKSFYNKRWLAPFGEYMPWISLIRYFVPLTWENAAFVPGERDNSSMSIELQYDKITIMPIICYDLLFAKNTKIIVQDNVNFIVQITNDTWFGKSIGPYQHLAIARLKAIELGLPMLRVANTGISAFIDSRGRIIKNLPYGSRGFIELWYNIKNKRS